MLLHALPFFISLIFLPILALGLMYGGWWTIACIVYAFIMIPVVDQLMGVSQKGLSADVEERKLFYHRLITWIWVPIQIALIFMTIYIAGNNSALANWEILALTIGVGVITGGIGITYAHELMHQTNRFEKALSEILMTSTLYGHFCIEHVHGHHINVGTPKDPVSARRGEYIYSFYIRAILGTFLSAWDIQKKRMARRGKNVWHYSNPFWRYTLAYIFYFAAAYMLAGWLGVGMFVLQAVIAILLLEVINYIEHYGLRRQLLENGRYEHVQPHHSWNSSHSFTNYVLINLQRHSDHHKNPMRRYPVLQHYEESEAPQLPMGYPTMLLIALVPPLWFKIMNHRVDKWKELHYPEETVEQNAMSAA